jgi:hypothetical protein
MRAGRRLTIAPSRRYQPLQSNAGFAALVKR